MGLIQRQRIKPCQPKTRGDLAPGPARPPSLANQRRPDGKTNGATRRERKYDSHEPPNGFTPREELRPAG